MDWIEANGAGLRYALSGEGRQTLVLVHEMGGTLESWDMLVPQLDPRFRVLRYDTRGAGISTKARSPLSIDTMAQDLESLLDALGVDGPVLPAGCAVGGAIALHFAATRPSRVRGLIAMGPATGIPEERRQAILGYADTVQRDGMAAVAETELARSYPEICAAMPRASAASAHAGWRMIRTAMPPSTACWRGSRCRPASPPSAARRCSWPASTIRSARPP
ncbi:alpha/beta fold hydrolase [Pseudoroseomonas wenyumeiae]